MSNNQSKATLWVLDTCLIVGLRPFTIIFITASLSSKTYNKALEPEWNVINVDPIEIGVRGWFVFACLVECLPTGFSVAL